MPCGSKRDFTSAACSAWLMSAPTLATITLGVPAGARMPNQESYSNSGTPASLKVGISGSPVRRLAPVTARPHLTALNEVAARVEEGEAHGDIAADDGGVGLGQPSDGKIDNAGIGNLFE